MIPVCWFLHAVTFSLSLIASTLSPIFHETLGVLHFEINIFPLRVKGEEREKKQASVKNAQRSKLSIFFASWFLDILTEGRPTS